MGRRCSRVAVAVLSTAVVAALTACAGDGGAAGPDGTAPDTATTLVGGCPEGPGTPSWLRTRYDLDSLLAADHDGGGVRVAVLSPGESADEAAVAAQASCVGSRVVLDQQAADGTEPAGPGERATRDVAAVITAAPGLDEVLVLTLPPGDDAAALEALDTVAAGAHGRIDVLLAPPSRCLAEWDPSVLQATEEALARLAGQGVWVVAAAGDLGSTPCGTAAATCPAPGSGAPAGTGYPASSAHVLAVGGTMVPPPDQLDAPPDPAEVALGPDGIRGTADDGTGPPTTTTTTAGGTASGDEADEAEVGDDDGGGTDGQDTTSEEPVEPEDVVWNDRWLVGATGCQAGGGGEAAGGPGIAAPDWQADRLRQVPDVAGLAGPPGVVVAGRDLRPAAHTGTSAAAALTVGGLATVRSALRSAGTDLDGPLARAVWLIAGDQAAEGDVGPAALTRDVTVGSNDRDDVGCCPADAGYDLASGWGALRFGALHAALRDGDLLRPWPADTGSDPTGAAPDPADAGPPG